MKNVSNMCYTLRNMRHTFWAASAVVLLTTCVKASSPLPEDSTKHAANSAEVQTNPTAAPETSAAYDSVDVPKEEVVTVRIPVGSTVMLVGDSLAVGMDTEFKRIAKAAGYKPVTHSIGGTTGRQWLPWLKSDVAVHKPALVLVSLGTNDSAANIDWLRKNNTLYVKLVKIVEDADGKVVWIGPPKLPAKRLPHVREVTELIRDSIGTFYYESQDLDFPRSGDQIHSTVEGYKIWMDAIWSWMSDRNIVVPEPNK